MQVSYHFGLICYSRFKSEETRETRLRLPFLLGEGSEQREGQEAGGGQGGSKRAAAGVAVDAADPLPGGVESAGETTSEDRAKVKAPRVRNYRKFTKEKIAESFPEIVGGLVSRAKKGQLGHTRLLFDLGGVKDDLKRGASRRREPSLGKLLLEEVEKCRKRAAEEAATGGQVPE